MSDIHPLTMNDRSFISGYLRRYPPEISEHTFTNLFIWQPYRPMLFSEIDNSLVFLVKADLEQDKYIIFGPPVGPIEIPDVLSAFKDKITGAARIPDKMADDLAVSNIMVSMDRDNADYVYRVKNLANLTGRRYTKKRNHIKQCLSRHTCEYVPMTPELIAECETMQEEWCHKRDCGRNPGLCNEANAISEAFAHFEEFGLLGGAIRVDGIIKAYAMAEELHPGTAVWHFEKAMSDIQGLGQLINQWFSKYGLTGFEYVNREQDLGIPGIRQAKKSYFPDHMVFKNYISLAVDQPITAKSIKAEGCAAHEQ
jgi:hypothetical protein